MYVVSIDRNIFSRSKTFLIESKELNITKKNIDFKTFGFGRKYIAYNIIFSIPYLAFH